MLLIIIWLKLSGVALPERLKEAKLAANNNLNTVEQYDIKNEGKNHKDLI